MSRRRFLHLAAGTLGALGTGLILPRPAWAAGRDPNPIPGGLTNPFGGPFIHHNFPGPADAPPLNGNDPSLITDFEGFIGQARVQGTGTGTNTDSGETFPLLIDADQRFMKGVYRSVDGRFLEARFVFIWIDLYQGQFDFANHSTQVHDYNPGFSPNGVFWTVPLPKDNPLLIDFQAAEATLIADLDVTDYTKIPNSFSLGAGVPAAITYKLNWSGPITREASVRDEANNFRGLFLENTATFTFSASQAGFKFVSDPANTSTSVFAQLGRESNGIFF